MRQTFRIVGISALILGLAIPAALACRGDGDGDGEGDGRGHGKRGGPFAGLELAADQEAAITALRQDMKTRSEPVRTKLKANREAVAAVWKSGRPDAAKLKSLAKERAALKAEIDAARIDHMVAAFNVLTPAQQTQAAERFAKMGDGHRKGRMGRGGKGGRGGDGPPAGADDDSDE
ncbi:MAG: Spy/CpxP family protein refolding chaperone [Myxococcota bacterium]